MSEFGHIAFRGKNVFIDVWGGGPFIMRVRDKEWRFEESDRFGPQLVKRNGDI